MKILSGYFEYGNTVTLEVDGKVITRKVRYSSLDGIFVVIDGERVGKDSFENLVPIPSRNPADDILCAID